MRFSLAKNYAPRCAHPDCNQQVSYHEKYIKADGTPGYKWKTFCQHHRTVGRSARDIFLKSKNGCENRYGTIGLPWTCGNPSTPSLTIDHWDGDKHNNDESNLKILCANCHNEKTKLFGDTKQRYHNINPNFYKLFDEVN